VRRGRRLDRVVEHQDVMAAFGHAALELIDGPTPKLITAWDGRWRSTMT
jgi:hypothetical protein